MAAEWAAENGYRSARHKYEMEGHRGLMSVADATSVKYQIYRPTRPHGQSGAGCGCYRPAAGLKSFIGRIVI